WSWWTATSMIMKPSPSQVFTAQRLAYGVISSQHRFHIGVLLLLMPAHLLCSDHQGR
uniref:Uncharacterized protein n=1 Tax=Aegilops tauschii subsp. strangulata TaxID=200361 RepID=A0A453G005_AEGTS